MKVQEEIKPTGDGARSERQDWRALRKLDTELAGRVMGWTRFPEPMHPTDNRTIEGVLYCPPGTPWNMNALNVVPHYSSDIVAAMQVVERFAEADWRIMLTSNPHAPQTLRWRVELFKELSPNNISVMELAETLPEAICLAALSAKAAESFTQTVVE